MHNMTDNQPLMPVDEIARLLETMNISKVSQATGVARHILTRIRDRQLKEKTPIGVVEVLTDFLRG